MSSNFSDGQLRQLGNVLAAADWNAEDITLMGQAGRDRLVGFRDLLRRGAYIVDAITKGRTELWLHDEQKEGVYVKGRVILAHLTNTGLLASCADEDELKAIQAKGPEFFRQHFAGKSIYGWRGIKDDRILYVPYLVESDGRVVLLWYWLDGRLNADSHALRRK